MIVLVALTNFQVVRNRIVSPSPLVANASIFNYVMLSNVSVDGCASACMNQPQCRSFHYIATSSPYYSAAYNGTTCWLHIQPLTCLSVGGAVLVPAMGVSFYSRTRSTPCRSSLYSSVMLADHFSFDHIYEIFLLSWFFSLFAKSANTFCCPALRHRLPLTCLHISSCLVALHILRTVSEQRHLHWACTQQH